MKLSVLTTITNPVERQDKFLEALSNYCTFADEVIVVNGGKKVIFVGTELNSKVKIVDMEWPFEWNWAEYPRHLNFGKQFCTGDFILRLDTDQLIHEKDVKELRDKLTFAPIDCEVVTMQKISYTYGGKYYQKGQTEVIIRNLPHIAFGQNMDEATDLCFPVHQTGVKVLYKFAMLNDELVQDPNPFYQLPIGKKLKAYKTGVSYHNYDYYFRDMEVTKREFWRASRAWNRYFQNWKFGDSEETSFKAFCNMIKGRHARTPLVAKLEDHPKEIRWAVKNIKEDRLGHSGWGIL